MFIIFLDIDGVCATRKSYEKEANQIDRGCIEVLNELAEQYKASVVISSSWRYMHSLEELKTMLSESGLKCAVIGVTSSLCDKTEEGVIIPKGRGKEIVEWIKFYGDGCDYLVLDDDSFDIKDVIPPEKFIHVKGGFMEDGLTREHILPYITPDVMVVRAQCPKCKGWVRLGEYCPTCNPELIKP